jgi:hypothetical protein
MAYIFQTLANKGNAKGLTAGSKEAAAWFRETASNIKTVSVPKLMNDKENVTNKIKITDIGRMFMYSYDPKGKQTLPYYDKFPLIILVSVDSDGFHGLNLHYLPPFLRAKLMDALFSLRNNNKYDDSTKLAKISYEVLSSASKFKYFAPCFKRYLYSHLQSNFLYVSPENWDKALMLPTERFAKMSKDKVFKESQRMV